MGDRLYAKRTTPDQVQEPAKTASQRKSSPVGDPTRPPLWATLAYGNQVPPSLRLPVAPSPQVESANQESRSPAENDMGEHLDRASQAASQGGETRHERAEPLQHKENSTGLPDTLKAKIERLSGISLDDVQVHYHSSNPAQVQALAYTRGTEIHIGPGQEQHLGHEAWHVVQQKQGRVQPTVQAKGVKINDDRELEREADVAAHTVMMANDHPYRSSALQIGQQLCSSSLPDPTLQRVVKTWGGEFDTDKYEVTRDVGNLEGGDFEGVEIELRFKPNSLVDAELIGLTQTVRNQEKGKPFTLGGYTPKLKELEESRMVPTGEPGAGTAIDQGVRHDNPLYAARTNPPTPGKTLTDVPAHPEAGQHGWHYTDKDGKLQEQDALLKDTPQLSTERVESSQVLETTALAIKGTQEGTFYGSVQWGWEKDSDGRVTRLPLTLASSDVPTSVFVRASQLFNESKTLQGKETIPLPIVTGQYTRTEGVSLVSDPSRDQQTLIGQLEKNTRLEVTDKGTAKPFNTTEEGKNWWKVTIVDGTYIGKVGWVRRADLSDTKTE